MGEWDTLHSIFISAEREQLSISRPCISEISLAIFPLHLSALRTVEECETEIKHLVTAVYSWLCLGLIST